MNILKNDFLIRAYNEARLAAQDESLSANDTVMHLEDGGNSFSGHRWVKLGGRSSDFKTANRNIRSQFWENVVNFFGGRENIERLPEDMRKELKLEDFKLDAHGRVTSQRPLTARRIMAICTMAKEWKEQYQLDNLPVGRDPEDDNSVDQEPDSVGQEPEGDNFVDNQKLEEKQNPLVKDLIDRVKNNKTTLGYAVRFIAANNDLHSYDIDIINEILSRFENYDREALQTVRKNAANRSSKEQCIIFGRLTEMVNKIVTDGLYDLFDPEEKISPEEIEQKVKDAIDNFDFQRKIGEVAMNEVKSDVFERFAKEVVNLRKEEYESAEGGVNQDLLEDDRQVKRTKYDNIIDSIDICGKLKRDKRCEGLLRDSVKKMALMKEWFEASKNKVSYDKRRYIAQYREAFPDMENISDDKIEKEFNIFREKKENSESEVKRLNEEAMKWNAELVEKNEQIDRDNADSEKWNHEHEQEIADGRLERRAYKPHLEKKEKCLCPEYPSTLTLQGYLAGESLKETLKMSSHAHLNTAAQMLESFTLFAELDELFFKCIDKDRENGNTKMFDALMDALNNPGCIQARSEPVLTVKGVVELNVDLNVPVASKSDSVEVGFGNKLRQLSAKGGDCHYDYVVKEYLTAVGENSTIKISREFIDRMFRKHENNENAMKVLTEYRVNTDEEVADVKDVKEIKVSAAFFAEPSVKDAMFEIFLGLFTED